MTKINAYVLRKVYTEFVISKIKISNVRNYVRNYVEDPICTVDKLK